MIYDMVQANGVWVLGQIAQPPIEFPVGNNLVLWWFVLGFASVWAIAAINRYFGDSAEKRGAVAFGFCLAVAAVESWFRGALNAQDVVGSILVVFAAAILFFNLWFKPSGLAAKIEGR